jgi:serine/threonine protein kinase
VCCLPQVAIDVASAMSYLHPAIIHRDLKPSNVLLDSSGRAKVCDFGIAKFKRSSLASAATTASTAGLAGTPAYMAPEIFEGQAASDKADVFSFALMLWECLTGRQPWERLTNPMQIIFAVGVQGQRPALPEDPALCPPELAWLVQQCWQEQPSARPCFREVLARLQGMQRALQGQQGEA